MKRNEFYSTWSSLHGGAALTGIVRGWLAISYTLVRPLARLKTSPHLLTIAGIVFAYATWIMGKSYSAIAFLVLSLLCDGIDGSLAILRRIQSTWGAVTDSVADRISEFFWALAFYSAGAPLAVVAVAWLFAGSQEYVRARMGGLGAKEIQVVTIAERPVRASLLFIALVGVHIDSSAPDLAGSAWLVMQAIAFLQVIRDGYRRLK